MMKTAMIPWLCVALASVGCAGARPWVPLRATAATRAEATLVWVGRGEAERFENGAWVRRPEFNYDFSVEQRRVGDHWESVKHMRRLHPGYDGSAGERFLTYFFQLDFARPDAAQRVGVRVTSTLGNGDGETDREFRRAELRFAAQGVSSFAPFDRYRITQHYDYEAGRLTETVELNKGAQPWVRNREVAALFGERRFDRPPTEAR
jgi:hypothetical protein